MTRPALLPRCFPISCLALALTALPEPVTAQAPTPGTRPMNFMDLQHMRRAGAFAPSPDGQWMLYTITTPDWQEATQQSDIHLVSLTAGVSSSRQMTYTEGKNESSPQWSRDGSLFVFTSNRETDENQLFAMRPDGGEARRITDEDDGVSNFAFSKDGRRLVYRSGESGEQQLYSLAVSDLDSGEPEQLTEAPAGIGQWELSPDSRRIYYIAPNEPDEDEKLRREKGFTVDIRNRETPLASLWVRDLDADRNIRLTDDVSYTVSNFTISDSGMWVGFTGNSAERYQRNITEQRINADLFLIEVATGQIERLTNNSEVSESGPSFSPDGRWIAFTAADDLTRYTMKSRRVYIREVSDRGGVFHKLGGSFHDHVTADFWSADGNTIYFNGGIKATRQFLALDIEENRVRQITNEKASVRVSRDEDSGTILIDYADAATSATTFTVDSLERVVTRQAWRQLTDVNPQVAGFSLGAAEEITWTSTDGASVGGVLIKPVGYQEGQRYPLVVSIHGGPASASVLSFDGNSQVYAGDGYVVLKPNYRGSSNYGEEFRTAIVGNYFPQGFEDIMTGIDYLIEQGIVDGDRMGAMGWSAGGHWSNWILTHTDRFKAISSGAGTSNWISMYAQSDVQRNRRYYLGDDFLYDNFEAYWEQSPIQYMRNAVTPTMIHVVAGDPRVPSPQSVELHMGLKKLGVDTELFMYPGNSHGIPDPRNRLVKAVSEKAWMDHYLRGIGDKFTWQDVLQTLEEEDEKEATEATGIRR